MMNNIGENLLPVKREPSQRDDLKISLTMAYVIVVLGVIGTLLQILWAGFSIFMILCNYSWMPNLKFLRYYAEIGPNIGFAHIFICLFSCLINAVYTLYSFLIINKRYAQVMFLISLLIGVVTLILALNLEGTDQIFHAMENRAPNWYDDVANLDWAEDWIDRVLTPYKIKDIFRSILFAIQAILFVFAHQFSKIDFAIGMEIPT